jgi:cytochrome c
LFQLAAPAGSGADAAACRALFSRCAACHSVSPGVNKVGPSLAGIMGSKTGIVPGSNFSTAMKNANVTWDEAALDEFLKSPSRFIAGTKMVFNVPRGGRPPKPHRLSCDPQALSMDHSTAPGAVSWRIGTMRPSSVVSQGFADRSNELKAVQRTGSAAG